jgi:hypothetical protein
VFVERVTTAVELRAVAGGVLHLGVGGVVLRMAVGSSSGVIDNKLV